jgi:glycosyltransferase involved in cell wall biosynthesis
MLRGRRRGGSRRVLYLVHALPPADNTGTPLVTHGYARTAQRLGWRATVVSADPALASWDDHRRSTDPSGFARYEVPAVQYGTWALAAASAPSGPDAPSTLFFARLLRQVAPDLVHVVDNVHLPLDWPELAASSGIPVIRTVSAPEDICALVGPVSPLSGPLGFCQAPLTPEFCARCYAAVVGASGPPDGPGPDVPALVDQLVAKRARAELQFGSVFDRIVFTTPGFRRYFEATIPLDPGRVRLIDMGLDVERWQPPAVRPPDVPGAPVVFALAGSLHPARGQQDAVQAFGRPALLARDDYRLHIMGNGDESLVAPLLERNHNVRLLGAFGPADFPELLAQAHVGVSTSLFETFHRVTREYLLAGLPVVANPTFGIEHLIEDGVNGLLYDRTDPDGLANAVCRLLDDRALLERLARGARETARGISSVEHEMEQLVALYDEVVPKGVKRRRSVLGRPRR